MAWTLFASLTSPKEPDLDANLAILANLSLIPVIMTGTNTITAQPISGSLPPLASYQNNQAFIGRMGNGNTGACTFQYQSLATINVYKDTTSGPAVLVGSEISQNMMGLFVYDQQLNAGVGGVHFINPVITGSGGGGGGGGGTTTIVGASTGAPGFRSNLKVLRASATTASVTARTIGVSDSGQASFFNIANLGVLLNAATVGANGLSTDVTGGTLGNSTFYYLYAIYAPATAVAAVLLSASATAPTLPAGYTLFARIGSLLTNGSAQILNFIQYDNDIQYVVDGTNPASYPLVVAQTTTTFTATDVVAGKIVPPTASKIRICGNTSTTGIAAFVSPNSLTSATLSTTNPAMIGQSYGTGVEGILANTEMLLESANIYSATSSGTFRVFCTGYEDNL